jgi:hypothetical protein
MMDIDPTTRATILDFVDQFVPAGSDSIWLTGSRARGDHRPNSDWDVIAFHSAASRDRSKLFESNQISTTLLHGGQIELAIVHPCFQNDPGCYMEGWRKCRIRLR